jgi:PrtD family type I secretion system ABC transporter
MLQVFDRVFASRSVETLVMLTIIAIVALLVMMTLDILRGRLLQAAGIDLDASLGPRVLANLLDRSAKGGPLNEASLRDVATVRGFLTGQGIIALFDTPWLPFYLFVIYLFHPLLGIAATVATLLLFLLAWANEKLTHGHIETATRNAKQAAKFIDTSLRNAEVVSALGMLPMVTGKWQRLNAKVTDAQIVAGRLAGLVAGITKFFRMATQVMMMGLGAWLVVHQDMTSGGMLATTIILGRALQPVESAIASWKGFVNAREAYRQLNDLLKREQNTSSNLELPAPIGNLQVDKVVVQLSESANRILNGVSFELKPGECLGVIGPSAAGKSTLCRILTGVWKPILGSVRLDGAELFQWDKALLGSHLGYLPQDVGLFPGTVAENIARLGNAGSEQVVQAAQRAFVHDMILKLPKGYDTDLGERAVNLSAGQRQRIGLARALFGNPKLVVLDEPNASLDAEGEEALMKSLLKLKQDGATVVIISHKPSILTQVDKMLVLREGRVEAFGPRDEVMAMYAKVSTPVTQVSNAT